jgi:homoserine O-acetyltransferase/O-succinyltransferase
MKPRPSLLIFTLFFALCAGAQKAPAPATKSGDFVIKDFHFRSGEVLPELRLHYNTLGTPVRGEDGRVTNAVLILHGTAGSGKRNLEDSFTQAMYGPGQPLDITRWYVILADSIGHGQSSKPSDALHANFPHYDYDDMVEAQYRLVTEGLGVNHLRLVAGTSIGGMHTWMWGEEHPDFMDALLPLVSQPFEIAGRNRMWRRTAADAIRNDPGYNNGDYEKPPAGLVFAARLFAIAVSGDLDLQRRAPTREDADRLLDLLAQRWVQSDANDLLYQLDSSRNYNPEPALDRIQARLIAVNASDDFINPPDLAIMPKMIQRVKNARYVELPSTGMRHGTVGNPVLWTPYLVELLEGKRN